MAHDGNHLIDDLKNILSRRERKVIEDPALRRAAVLVPFYRKDGETYLLFTKRTERVKHHKGEISFPGGVYDDGDGHLEATALRESFEEVGLKQTDVRIIGALDDIVTTTRFIVTPFVGVFPYPYDFELSPIEIEELIEVPLSTLLEEGCFAERTIIHGERKREVPSYQSEKHIIWGATARILRQLLELLPPAE